MTDRIEKALRKLSAKEREVIKLMLLRIKLDDTAGMDIKLLRGHKDLFRVRKGRLRIVYRKNSEMFHLLKIDQRDDQTYKEF